MSKRKNNTERLNDYVKQQTKLGESENRLRAAYLEMRDGRITREENLKDIFKPITNPIYKILGATFDKVKNEDGSVDLVPKFVTPKNISDASNKLISSNLSNTEELIFQNEQNNQNLQDLITTTNNRSRNIEELLINLNVSTDVLTRVLTERATPEEIKMMINDQVKVLIDASRNKEIAENEDKANALLAVAEEASNDMGALDETFFDSPETEADLKKLEQIDRINEIRPIINKMLEVLKYENGKVISENSINKRKKESENIDKIPELIEFYFRNEAKRKHPNADTYPSEREKDFIKQYLNDYPSTTRNLRPKKNQSSSVVGDGLINFKTGYYSGSSIKVDMNALLKNNHLKVTKKGSPMINKIVDADTVAILTTPSHPSKKYSKLAIKTIQDMHALSRTKLGEGNSKQKFIDMKNVLLIKNPSHALKKLEIIQGSMLTGNTSDMLKNQASELIDYLLQEGKITKDDHKSLFKSFKII